MKKPRTVKISIQKLNQLTPFRELTKEELKNIQDRKDFKRNIEQRKRWNRNCGDVSYEFAIDYYNALVISSNCDIFSERKTNANQCLYKNERKFGGGKTRLCGYFHCDFCWNKSFASHHRARYWNWEKNFLMDKEGNYIYDDNESPIKIMPWHIPYSSHNYYDFFCMMYHEYSAQPTSVTSTRGNEEGCWCSFHQKPRKWIKTFEEENPEISETWDYEANFLGPDDFSAGSSVEAFFVCKECCHRYKTQLCHISISKTTRCPYCSGLYICGRKDCQMCYEKSFAIHYRAKYMLEGYLNGYLKSYELFCDTNYSFWFRCEKKHKFEATLHSISQGSKWCPHCRLVSLAEDRMECFLSSFFGKDRYKRDAKFNWAISDIGHPFRYDFHIPEFSTLLEIDGEQHFRENEGYWIMSLEEQQERDVLKMKLAIENGMSVIRITGRYVMLKSFTLDRVLPFIKKENHPVCIFLSSPQRPQIYKSIIRLYFKKYILGIE